jgi:hypothetical protein
MPDSKRIVAIVAPIASLATHRPVMKVARSPRGLRRYPRIRGNQSAIDGMNINSATKTKSATKNGSVPM